MTFSQELREFIEASPFAALCVLLDLGTGEEAVLILKGSRDVMEGLREASKPPDLGWVVHATAWGPVVCLVARGEAEGVGDLAAEALFDPSDPSDLSLLETLSGQARLRCVCLGEDTDVIWTPEIPWGELQQLQVDQARDRAEELLERCPEPDFDRARDAFQAELSFESLLRHAFHD